MLSYWFFPFKIFRITFLGYTSKFERKENNMKRICYLIVPLWLMFSLFIYHSAYANVFKWMRVGKYRARVVDSGDQGQASGEDDMAFYYYDNEYRGVWDTGATHFACRDWYDENNTYHAIKLCAMGMIGINEEIETMPVPDSEGIYIRKYMRYQPPSITVDGYRLDAPFPWDKSDEVNPDYILGNTADVMVESWFNLSMGLTIHQRAFSWSQINHDDYDIREFTITNTGNVDLDDEIELPDQTIEGFYFLRNIRTGHGYQQWNWRHEYGGCPGDTLRLVYVYPHRDQGTATDNLGEMRSSGFPRSAYWRGEAHLHVDTSPTDKTDDITQPQMTGEENVNCSWLRTHGATASLSDVELIYQTMQFGFLPYNGQPYMEGTYPNTHHSLSMDMLDMKTTRECPWQRGSHDVASGPYTLKPGESIRIVWSDVMGTISPEKAWEIGKAWQDGTCTWDGPDDLAEYYPAFGRYPELAPTANDQAKDRWIFSGKDSLFINAWAAQWNTRNDYEVPIAPSPPSVEVNSRPDRIEITWGNESESASDFAGYRVYRAVGSPYYDAEDDVVVGKWEPIFECGEGTANNLTHSYDDATAERGKAYFYYVTAFDDGIQNETDARGQKESLESGQYLNQTTRAAYLTRPAGTLSSVRVVPNPFNINAAELQYIGEPDKIMFLDIPPVCTIKIYSESGDLVKTLEHTDGSGDEPWGVLLEEHLVTEIGQIIVSGIYIAHIETPTGESTAVKFVIVR